MTQPPIASPYTPEHLLSLKQKRFAVFAHSASGTTGNSDELVAYLRACQAGYILHVRLPFALKDRHQQVVHVAIYEYGILVKEHRLHVLSIAEPLNYLQNALCALGIGLYQLKNIDLVIASDNLLGLVAYVLKLSRCCQKNSFFMVDYTPKRFAKRWLNDLYYTVDALSSYKADRIWPLEQAMIDGRVRHGRLQAKRCQILEVPSGNYADEQEVDRQNVCYQDIVYLGGILPSKGSELFVPIAQALRKQGCTSFRFVCIGDGQLEKLKKDVEQAKLQAHFEICGPIASHRVIEEKLKHCGVAIAPYADEDLNSFSYYADPGKIKVYLGCQLPIVLTDVPPIAKKLQAFGAGLIACYAADDLAEKILTIIAEPQAYWGYRSQARLLGLHYHWGSIFKRALEDIL